MSYYRGMGDYYRGRGRGDFLGVLKSVAGGIGSVAKSFLGIPSSSSVPQPSFVTPQQFLGNAFNSGIATGKTIARGITTGTSMFGGAQTITGHPVHKKHKRMNPANPKALRRAIRRVDGFVGLAKHTLKGTGYTITRSHRLHAGKKKRTHA